MAAGRKKAPQAAAKSKNAKETDADAPRLRTHTPVTGAHMSAATFADELGFDAATVRDRLRAINAEPSGEFRGFPLYRLRDLYRAAVSTADGKIDPEKLRPFERNAHYKAEREKLELQLELREVIPRLETEAGYAHAFKHVAQLFDTLPDILERECGASPDMLSRVERALDTVREELYKRLVAERDDAADLI